MNYFDDQSGGVPSRGVVRHDKRLNTYFVDIFYKGIRHRVYNYLGTMPCPTTEAGEHLRIILNDEINRDPHRWTPIRHKNSRPLRIQKYAQTWIDTLDVSKATMHDYLNSLKNHILPAIGDEYLPEINTNTLKILQKKIPRAPKGKKNVMDCLKMILVSAEKSNYIPSIPEFPKLKVPKAKIRYIIHSDQWKIVDQIPAAHRYVFIFMILTGCRPSEARAFRKSDIRNNHIIFAKTFGRGEEFKNVKGFNEAPFPLHAALKELLESTPKHPSPFVFINSNTGKHYSKNINRIWNKACERANVQRIRLGINRHSFGCNALNAGVDKSIVQKLLRHTNSQMTDRYAEYSTDVLAITLDNVFHIKNFKDASYTKEKNC